MRAESPGYEIFLPLPHEWGKSEATEVMGGGWVVPRSSNGKPFIKAWLLDGILWLPGEIDADLDQARREIMGLLAEVYI